MLFLLIFIPAITIAACAHGLLQAWAPSNILVRHVRASRLTFRLAGALGVLAFACLAAMHLLAEAIESGAPGWLNLVVLVLAWDAIKIGWLAAWVMFRSTSRAARTGRVAMAGPLRAS